MFEARQFSAVSARQDYIFSSSQGYHRKEHPLLPLERAWSGCLQIPHAYATATKKAKKSTSKKSTSRSKLSSSLALADPKTAELALETGTIVTSVVNLP